MRTLTIHREKTFVGCIMPVYIYITDEFDGDIKIKGEKCRLLGSVGNGQTKTFTISGRKAALYGACGKGDLYKDRLELPCSEKNITLSGKCTLGQNKGNPFRFHRPSVSADQIEAVIKTAGLIACGDKEVIYAVRDMVISPMEYFAVHREEYLERGIDDWSNLEVVVWFGMVDILLRHHYATERDYKDEKEDFVYFLASLNNVKQNGLTVNPDILDEDESITWWCAAIDGEWEAAGYCMGCIDINSDSYVLFPAKISLMDRLYHYATCLGYSIVYAGDD